MGSGGGAGEKIKKVYINNISLPGNVQLATNPPLAAPP